VGESPDRAERNEDTRGSASAAEPTPTATRAETPSAETASAETAAPEPDGTAAEAAAPEADAAPEAEAVPEPDDDAAEEPAAEAADAAEDVDAGGAAAGGDAAGDAEPAADEADAADEAADAEDAPRGAVLELSGVGARGESEHAATLDEPTTALRVPYDPPTQTLRQFRGFRLDPDEVDDPAAEPEEPVEQSAPAAALNPAYLRAFDAVPIPAPEPAPEPALEPAPGPGVGQGVGQGVGPGAGPAPEGSPETTSEALELLATLSRRPMTPLRRAAKRTALWGGLLCVVLAVLAVVQVLRPLPTPQLRLTAASEYTFGGSAPALSWPTAGQSAVEVDGLGSLGQNGAETAVPIASVTKVMTAHLILKDHPLAVGQQGPVITVDQQAVTDYTNGTAGGESVMKVSANEQLTEYQALQMLLIPSANNVARLLGRWDAGTDAAFVAKMQAEATALGMSQTTYTDPSGLEDTTKSTAADQLKLAKVVMETPVFREIVSTQSFSPPENPLTYNTNKLLGANGVIGVKTGSDSAALGCLMWAAQVKIGGTTQTVLGVTLGQPALSSTFGILDNVMATSKKLLVSAEGVLQSHILVHQGEVVGYVDDGEGGRTPVVASKDVNVIGWSGTSVPVSLEATGGVLPRTGRAGDGVGELVVGTGVSAQRIPINLQSDLAEPSYGTRLTRLG